MAHVHLEDGSFTLFWVLAWSAVAAALVSVALWKQGRGQVPTRKLAIASMCVAVGFAAFQIEVPVFGGVHLNLTPLMGILVGPALATLCVLIINIFSAAIGHGGWSMIGANTLVNIVEVVLGFYVYHFLRSYAKVGRFRSGFGAAAVALTVSALVAVAIVAVSEIQGSVQTRAQIVSNLLVLAVANIVTGMVEGVVTGYIVSFLGRVRPDLIGESAPPRPREEEHPQEAATCG